VSTRVLIDRFTTADFDPRDRHDAGVSVLRSLIDTTYRTDPLETFRSAGEMALLGDMRLLYIDIAAQRWERDRRLVDLGDDSLSFTVNLDGAAYGIAGTQAFVQTPGSGLLVDRTQTSLHDSAGGRSIGLSFSRQAAIEAGLDPFALHGLVLAPADIAIYTAHAAQVQKALASVSAADGERLGRTLFDVMVLALRGAGRTEARRFEESRDTLAMRVRREVHAHLGSPALTIGALCRRLSVSRSTLHRLFEEQGGLQAYIRDARLDAAKQALLDSANGERIADIADRLGFSDAAHLSRLFRARFGQSPSDCRARAAGLA
jgi:AraC-like DNA-binding protein